MRSHEEPTECDRYIRHTLFTPTEHKNESNCECKWLPTNDLLREGQEACGHPVNITRQRANNRQQKSRDDIKGKHQLAKPASPLRSVVGGLSTVNAHSGKGPSAVNRSVDVG